MTTNDVLINAAKLASIEQAQKVITSARSTFLDLFGSFVQVEDVRRLGDLFDKAAAAKVAQFMASTDTLAQEFGDMYDTYMASIETLGDQYLIVGKAKAGVFLRSMVHQIISGAFAIAGAVLQAGLGVVLPGIGSLIGAGLNAGLQHVVAHFLGD